jgi:predicted porin
MAQAQSAVMMYGIFDDGFHWTFNAGGHNLYNMSTSVLQASRCGLRANEDLGGVIATLFVPERCTLVFSLSVEPARH